MKFIILTQQNEPLSKNRCLIAVEQIALVKTAENNGGRFFCSIVYIKSFQDNIKVQETPLEIQELITKKSEGE